MLEDREHIELLWGNPRALRSRDFVRAALVAPGQEGDCFVVQFTVIERYYAYKKRSRTGQKRITIVNRMLEWLAGAGRHTTQGVPDDYQFYD